MVTAERMLSVRRQPAKGGRAGARTTPGSPSSGVAVYGPIREDARAKTASSMSSVSFPVKVFCWEG